MEALLGSSGSPQALETDTCTKDREERMASLPCPSARTDWVQQTLLTVNASEACSLWWPLQHSDC